MPQMHMALPDQQMVIGWSNVDLSISDGLSILGVRRHQWTGTGDDRRQDAVALLCHVDSYKDGSRKISRKAGNKFPDGVKTTGGGADDDDVAGRHAHLDAGSAASTATSRLVFAGNT